MSKDACYVFNKKTKLSKLTLAEQRMALLQSNPTTYIENVLT